MPECVCVSHFRPYSAIQKLCLCFICWAQTTKYFPKMNEIMYTSKKKPQPNQRNARHQQISSAFSRSLVYWGDAGDSTVLLYTVILFKTLTISFHLGGGWQASRALGAEYIKPKNLIHNGTHYVLHLQGFRMSRKLCSHILLKCFSFSLFRSILFRLLGEISPI